MRRDASLPEVVIDSVKEMGNGNWELGIGIVLFAQNVAPTIEVVVIAAGSTPINLLVIAAVSMGICGLVFDFADFHGTGKHVIRGSWP